MTDFCVTSMTAPLRRVAVRSLPAQADFLQAAWHRTPDHAKATDQHAAFVAALESTGAQVELLPTTEGMADSCFTYDPVFVVGRGMIELQQGKPARVDEPSRLSADLAALGVPVAGRLTGDARADGGDLFWLDEHTLAAGRGYRTNAAAHTQLREILAEESAELVPFDLPHDQGPGMVLHLMSLASLVDDKLAVVFEPMSPVPLLEALAARGIEWIAVSPAEYAALGTNILATAPGRVLMFEGAPETAAALRARGVEVNLVDCSEIAIGDGGPTCLTRPLLRSTGR